MLRVPLGWRARGHRVDRPRPSGVRQRGLKRLGIEPALRHYYSLHAVLDVKHSEAWNLEVVRPLVASAPEAARANAEGALMRLDRGAACFNTYKKRLWGADTQSYQTALR